MRGGFILMLDSSSGSSPLCSPHVYVSIVLHKSRRAPNEVLSGGIKHWECVKHICRDVRISDTTQARTVEVDSVQLKASALRIVHVGRKDETRIVRQETGSKVCAVQRANKADGKRIINVHHIQLHTNRLNESKLQQVQIICQVRTLNEKRTKINEQINIF